MKLREGDFLLVYGQYHVEKAKVIKVNNGVITLNNQMKIDKQLKCVNSKTLFNIEPWDEEKYKYLFAKSMISKKISKIEASYKDLDPEKLVKVYDKLSRIVEKYM